MTQKKLFAFCQQDDEALYARVYLHDHRWTNGGHLEKFKRWPSDSRNGPIMNYGYEFVADNNASNRACQMLMVNRKNSILRIRPSRSNRRH